MSDIDFNLNDHDPNELAHATSIQDGIVWVDGCRVSTLPNRLYKGEDVFPVDFYNAVFESDERAISHVNDSATLAQF